jgi:hypothetical protein
MKSLNEGKNNTPSKYYNVNSIITEGNWIVTLFDEDGVVKTSEFSGYAFDFNVDGSLIASLSGAPDKTGTWNSTTDSGKVKIPIAFATETDGPFESISEDWKVLTATSAKIELQHISGGDGSTDLLTFEKAL